VLSRLEVDSLVLVFMLGSVLVAERRRPGYIRELAPFIGRAALWLLGYLAAGAALFVVVMKITGTSWSRALLATWGMMIIVPAIARPSFWWDDYRAVWVRRQLGDMGATVAYVLLGALLIVLAAFGPELSP
jgi:hypothetical protein